METRSVLTICQFLDFFFCCRRVWLSRARGSGGAPAGRPGLSFGSPLVGRTPVRDRPGQWAQCHRPKRAEARAPCTLSATKKRSTNARKRRKQNTKAFSPPPTSTNMSGRGKGGKGLGKGGAKRHRKVLRGAPLVLAAYSLPSCARPKSLWRSDMR